MPFPETIVELVERFEANRASYVAAAYNEAQTRQEFINPFFAALGWDVDNAQGFAEAYKDVVHEDAIKVGGVTKAPDYSFRIGGTRKFFLEAKKPSVVLKFEKSAAFQLRRYAWSAKLPLSILTNFAETAVYDCRIEPSKDDQPSKARLFYFSYKDYAEKWDEIAGIFSKNAILKGSFDKFAESSKGKRGTAEVDAAFLAQIEEWRDLLARNLALRNPNLSQRDLNFAVQRTIDRIVFLRICEDRGMESYGALQALLNGTNCYSRLCQLFHAADERYNSGLFHFAADKARPEEPDGLTLNLGIDDKTLKDILRGLYYPDSPYVFSVIPSDILGQAYEQFLGKVIRLTSGHRAVIEDKPEVKKAGGVYYTPTYIVDYIVRNTLGKLLDGKTPKDAAKLRVLDPACGSGSFLIGAFQFLLDWHRDWYVADGPTKHKKELYAGPGGAWQLTAATRKSILRNSIYGVDIDAQAVEVTKLSLLLKVLEGESAETLNSNLKLFKERALPDLGDNIKCGNSLIGPDFYALPQAAALGTDELLRINPFDWSAEFKAIMQSGGFDAVIGNPPYGFHQIHETIAKEYFKTHYEASAGSFENYFLFYEASLKLLRKDGLHGYIVPVTWLTIPSASNLRNFILSSFALRSIDWLPELVFKNAQVNTLVSIIQKSEPGMTTILLSEVNDPSQDKGIRRSFKQLNAHIRDNAIHIFEDPAETVLIEKIIDSTIPLSKIARPCSGYNPYEVGKGLDRDGNAHSKATIAKRPYHCDKKINENWKPEATGKDLGRYSLQWPLSRFVEYGPWLSAARDPQNFVGPRLLVQEITGGDKHRIVATFCQDELYYSRDIIPIKCDEKQPHPLFLLGILNSWLITWIHHRRNPKANKALFPKVLVGDLKAVPIRTINFDDPADKAKHDKMVALVKTMLKLHKDLPGKMGQEKTVMERQIAATDGQIDKLVYELYGLTEAEVKIVEGVG